MILRAAIFDLYGTILEFGPAPADAPARWARAWHDALGRAPRLDLAEFTAAARAVVAAEHAAARAHGIPFPEVHWPAVVDAVLPEFAALPLPVRLASPVYGADLNHTVRLLPGAAKGLHAAAQAGLLLGLASNCQPYTLRELDTALTGTGFDRGRFDPRLTFLSFEHGFSKPDPHVFRLLTARLRLLGIPPAATLMVGDREDNDLAPARAQGWQAARIGRETATADWRNLQELLSSGQPPRPS
jgi:FMN phosphatase YigB (HAD superfamily)